MQREVRRRKFHESLLNMLYPPPPSPPHQDEINEKPVNFSLEGCNADHIPDANESEEERRSSSSSSGDNEVQCGSRKLTRAQRKRLRKKKLREAASRRRKIIGPLLPNTINEGEGEGGDVPKNEPQGVRHNAAEEPDSEIDKPGQIFNGETASCTNQNKLKNRRMAKKLVRESSKSFALENCHQDPDPCNDNQSLT